MSYKTPEHFCTCPMVAMTIKTTGERFYYNDIVSLTMIPVDETFRPSDVFMPLHLEFCPKRPKNYKIGGGKNNKITSVALTSILERGTLPHSAVEKFDAWFRGLNLKPNKRLIPLVWDWSDIRPFLDDWFSITDKPSIMFDYFNNESRSLRHITSYLNDVAWSQSYPYPFVFQDNRLSRTITSCDDTYEDPHTTYGECQNLLIAFRNLVSVRADMGRLMVDPRYRI